MHRVPASDNGSIDGIDEHKKQIIKTTEHDYPYIQNNILVKLEQNWKGKKRETHICLEPNKRNAWQAERGKRNRWNLI